MSPDIFQASNAALVSADAAGSIMRLSFGLATAAPPARESPATSAAAMDVVRVMACLLEVDVSEPGRSAALEEEFDSDREPVTR